MSGENEGKEKEKEKEIDIKRWKCERLVSNKEVTVIVSPRRQKWSKV